MTAVAWAVAGFVAGTVALRSLVGRCIRAAEHAETGCSDEELEAMLDAACVRHRAGRQRWTVYDQRMYDFDVRCMRERGDLR
jgi:hypothetical protein